MREFDTARTRRILPDLEPPKSVIKPPAHKFPDGFVLFYAKDGDLYPVGLTKEQMDMLPIALGTLGTLKVFINMPQGKAENMLQRSDER